MRQYRVAVVEEVAGLDHRGMVRYRARPDLAGAVKADTPGHAKRLLKLALPDDKRFQGLTVVSIALREHTVVHVIVRSAHLTAAAQIPGRVYKAHR